jgi:hypothetical protein
MEGDMTKYRYHIAEASDLNNGLEEHLNNWAAEGWELVQVMYKGTAEGRSYYDVIWRREA